MGMSNGGMMALRYAMEAGDRLAGVAAVSASMATDSRCPSIKAPLSLLMVGGTADGIVPWDGGPVGKRQEGARPGDRGRGHGDALARARRPVRRAARSESVPHRDPADPTRAQRTVWGAQPGGLQIELLRIDGGGHVEPSVAHRVSAAYSGWWPPSGDIEVADEAWTFFRDKRRLSR
jgi:polyhydroxybutyrate depolymerase